MDPVPPEPEIVEAAKLLAPLFVYEGKDWGKARLPAVAEMLAEETARQSGGELFAEEIGESPGLTLMAYSWRAGEGVRAVLLPESYWRRDVAVAAWGSGLPNLFDNRNPHVEWEGRHSAFVLDVVRHVWPTGSRTTRLAAIARLYRSCYGTKSAREARKVWQELPNAFPAGDLELITQLPEILGKKEIFGEDSWRQLEDLLRATEPSIVPEIMGAAEKGPLSRTLAIADKRAEQIRSDGVERENVQPLMTHVPLSIFRDAPDDMSPMEALSWFLVEDPEGPRLTHQAATDAMGWKHHSQISTHLARIREKGLTPPRATERAMTLLRSAPTWSMIRAIQIQAPKRPPRTE